MRVWTAVGMDNVPRAIAAARARNSTDPTFVITDVTALPPADLGTFDFLFDVGCLHGLDGDQLREAGRSLSAVTRPGATLLRYVAQPTQSWLVPVGMPAPTSRPHSRIGTSCQSLLHQLKTFRARCDGQLLKGIDCTVDPTEAHIHAGHSRRKDAAVLGRPGPSGRSTMRRSAS